MHVKSIIIFLTIENCFLLNFKIISLAYVVYSQQKSRPKTAFLKYF
ncbi:hypothetical protein [Moraxella lacunata]